MEKFVFGQGHRAQTLVKNALNVFSWNTAGPRGGSSQ